MRRTLFLFSLLFFVLRMLSAAAFTGKVVDESGKPVAGTQVCVVLPMYDGQQVLDLRCDATGGFTVQADPKLLWPGNMRGWIAAYAPGYALVNATLEESGNVIVLHPGASIGRTSWWMRTANRKTGVPVTLDSWRDHDYQLAIMPESWRSRFTVRSAADGAWTLPGVPQACRVWLASPTSATCVKSGISCSPPGKRRMPCASSCVPAPPSPVAC